MLHFNLPEILICLFVAALLLVMVYVVRFAFSGRSQGRALPAKTEAAKDSAPKSNLAQERHQRRVEQQARLYNEIYNNKS